MIIDLHEDISHYYLSAGVTISIQPFNVDLPGRHVDIPKYEKAGVRLVLGSIFPMVSNLNRRLTDSLAALYGEWSPSTAAVSPRELAIEQVKIYYALEETYPERIKIVRDERDLEELNGRVGIILHIEGCEALSEPEDLKVFYRLGVRSIGITWNYDNKYASSCLSKKDYGLTGEGEELVKIANRLGVMVDLSHAGRQTCQDVIELSEQPPYISHANAYSVKEHPRNVPDDTIIQVGRRGGVIGLTFITSCIGEPADAEKLSEHASHIARVAGEGVLALGTDYLGIRNTPTGLEDITKIDKLREALARRLGEGSVHNILYANALRYIRGFAPHWRP